MLEVRSATRSRDEKGRKANVFEWNKGMEQSQPGPGNDGEKDMDTCLDIWDFVVARRSSPGQGVMSCRVQISPNVGNVRA